MSQNINDLIKDYYDDMPICEICKKYNVSYTTYFKILKKANVKRRISSKTQKLFNVIVEKKDDNSVKPVFHKPIDEPSVKVVKTSTNIKGPKVKDVKDLKDVKDPNLNKAFNEAKQCINKVKKKYEKKSSDDDKS